MKRKTILETLASLAVMLVLFVVLLVGCEKSIIYHPDKYPVGLWQTDQAPVPIEDVWFQAKDGVKLHGWYVPHPEPAASLLFFHGNAGNLSHRLDNILVLQSLRLNIFIFDYRGYGRSEGDPGETGILLDGQAAYDTLMSRPGVSPQKLFIFGRSLGGSFAAQIAAKNPVAGVIIESCFTNASDMADEMLPLLPMRWFISSKFDTLTAVSNLKIPKLFLHGTHDEIIPYELGRKLYEGAADPKEFYDIVGAMHNNTIHVGGQRYFDKIGGFITRTLARPQKPENQ